MRRLVEPLRLGEVVAAEALVGCPGNVLGVSGWFVESYGEIAVICHPQLAPYQMAPG